MNTQTIDQSIDLNAKNDLNIKNSKSYIDHQLFKLYNTN